MAYNESNLVGSHWQLKQIGADLKDSEIEFRSHGKLYDSKTPEKEHTWSLANNTITISYNNGYAVYNGIVEDNKITGSVVNKVGDEWTFKAFKVINGQPLSSDTNPASDEEILPTARQKEEFTYFYYFAYYPTRYKVSEKLQSVRQIIYSFKDGRSSKEIAKAFSEDVDYLNLDSPISNWWLCIIPASTKEKTETRFKNFCEKFCELTRMNNGYSLIINKSDRNAVHLQEDRSSVNVLESIDFKDIKGKNILLFDDIYTTGKSFLKVARRLKALGAGEIVGLFLGKTHWLEDITE
jgi:predicted amidophosphoribosyltransferase